MWQPYSFNERLALFVGHNCPTEIVESFSFDLSLAGYGAAGAIQADADHADAILFEGDDVSVSFPNILRKTKASADVDNDAGLFLSEDFDAETLQWSYSFSYADGTWLQ